MKTFNVNSDEWDATRDRDGWRCKGTVVGQRIGGELIGATMSEVEPGSKLWPYHTHYLNEEWVIVDDDIAGTIGSWGDAGEREVTYWIGRSYWGKGIATNALNAFLALERSRPLHARVASDNVASRRVLEKCGFGVIATERNVAEARSAEIEELVLLLDEHASAE
jgi:RimJ/RimL family protein N-acetyltransferase